LKQYKNSIRQWLIDNDYNDIAELIDEVTAEWDRQGKKTRRNWWEVLAGDKDGKPRTVEGRKFPVLRAARLRQGLPDTKGSLSRHKREVVPPVVDQIRWKGHDKKSASLNKKRPSSFCETNTTRKSCLHGISFRRQLGLAMCLSTPICLSTSGIC
jgi:hypothetical protein